MFLHAGRNCLASRGLWYLSQRPFYQVRKFVFLSAPRQSFPAILHRLLSSSLGVGQPIGVLHPTTMVQSDDNARQVPVHGEKEKEPTFYYFAYGSNLFAERIHINCPSATRLCPARLKGYHLAFNYNSLRWRGHVATIKESDKDSMWGCIWVIRSADLPALDLQEGVHLGLYRPLAIDVTTAEGSTLQARTYQMTLPYEESALPSVVYKRVMTTGARESALPEEYVSFIENLPDNGYDGPVEVECNLVYRQDSQRPHFGSPEEMKLKPEEEKTGSPIGIATLPQPNISTSLALEELRARMEPPLEAGQVIRTNFGGSSSVKAS